MRLFLIAPVAATAIVVLLAGCWPVDHPDPPPAPGDCKVDYDCPPGYVCVHGSWCIEALDMTPADLRPGPCGRAGEPCCLDALQRTFCLDGTCTANGCEVLDMTPPPDTARTPHDL